MNRRVMILGGAAVLAACGAEAPRILTVRGRASAGANSGSDGAERAVTVTVLQMSAVDAFDAAGPIALQDPETALATDLIRADRLVVPPMGDAEIAVPLDPAATVVGVVAGFLDPAGRRIRQRIALPPAGAALVVTLGPTGLVLDVM